MARSCYISVITAYTADSIDRRNTIFVGHWVRPETDSALPHWDKHSAVLGLVQDEPALRAGAASGILDKTCARRYAGGRSAPRNGPLSLTKEYNLDLGSGEAASEGMVTSQHAQFRTSLDMADISNWSSASAGVCQASVFCVEGVQPAHGSTAP